MNALKKRNSARQRRRQLLAALNLAISRSAPPLTMPGYYRVWKTWERIAMALGATPQHKHRLLVTYQAAAYRISQEGQA